MINQNDLIYFLELAKTRHVTRAAERLGVTQPTLSHSMKRIETEIGVQLFIRTKKGIELTPSADRLLTNADELLSRWNDLKRAALDEVYVAKGIIRLGVHTAVAQYVLPELLPRFLRAFPEIQINLVHGLSRHITEMVLTSQVDVGIIVNPVRHPELVIKELIVDRVALWKSKDCINDETLILEPSLIQTQSIMQKLTKKGLQFSRILESSSLEVIAQLTQAGAGCAILPERVMKAFCDHSVHQVKDSPEFKDHISLVHLQKTKNVKRGQVLIDHIRAIYK